MITEKSVYELFVSHHLFIDNLEMFTEDGETTIRVGISWGDWKHEHLRAELLLNDFLNEHGIHGFSLYEDVTEEDGSDCYSADHVWRYRV